MLQKPTDLDWGNKAGSGQLGSRQRNEGALNEQELFLGQWQGCCRLCVADSCWIAVRPAARRAASAGRSAQDGGPGLALCLTVSGFHPLLIRGTLLNLPGQLICPRWAAPVGIGAACPSCPACPACTAAKTTEIWLISESADAKTQPALCWAAASQEGSQVKFAVQARAVSKDASW